MNEEDLVFLDKNKSISWNYVNRVDKELSLNKSHESAMLNPLMPKSYKDVIMIMSRACNYSRVALLLDDDEEYVAFMLVVDDEYVPFMLEGLADVVTPMDAVYKVFSDTDVATSHVGDVLLTNFIAETVIPDLNENFNSWSHFKTLEENEE